MRFCFWMKRRAHVFYSGRVQGVGFRVTAEETAMQFGLVGWVRNLRDGRVEVVAEAEESKLEAFLDTIQTGSMKNFIQGVELSWSNASDTFDQFDIRYY